MNSEHILLKNIETFGKRYCKDYLHYNRSDLKNNCWSAMEFILSRTFLRGRSDKLSNEYCSFAEVVLKDRYEITANNLNKSLEYISKDQKSNLFNINIILDFKEKYNLGRKNSIKQKKFNEEIRNLNEFIDSLVTPREMCIEWDKESYTKEVYLGNDEDIMMIMDVMNLMNNVPDKNIYTYIKDGISTDITKIYGEIKDLRAIGPKISTLLLRDILLLNLNEITIKKEFYKYFFPVDTWVETIFYKLEKTNKNKDELAKDYINKCLSYKINPALFAAGLWYLGYNSLEIILNDFIKDKEINI